MTEYKMPENLFQAMSSDIVIKGIAAGIFVLSFTVCISCSWVSGLVVLTAYAVGFVSCMAFRNHIFRLGLKLSTPRAIPVVSPRAHQCSVCGNQKCGRHRPVTPLLQQTVLPEQVDHALQLLFEKILELYIERWHSKVSEDPSFEQELRLSIQSAVSTLLFRADQLDESRVITERLIPAAIAHFDTLLRCSRKFSGLHTTEKTQETRWHTASEVPGELHSPDEEKPQWHWELGEHPDAALDLPWHPATLSRRHELAYLRHIILHILPSILPSYQLSCKAWGGLVREILARWVLLPAMDLLADGAVILRLLEKLLEHTPILSSHYTFSRTVPTLQRFVTTHAAKSCSSLQVGLNSVLKEPQLLYHFMQFLKKVGAVHVLQFCLDLEKFNDRMLEPELGEDGLSELYQEAWDLFSLYFLPSSPDCVSFPAEIISEMQAVLKGGENNILRLRNTPPLFQAFEFAYTKLERDLLPLFHHSEEYFIMLCNGRLSKFRRKKSPRQRDELGSAWAKGTGSAAFAEVRADTWGTMGPTSPDMPTHRNLGAWRLSVPRVYLRPEMPGSSRISAVMVIAVQRIDISEEDDPADCGWTVYRTHADFCALTSKLQEFHGDFDQLSCTPLKRPLTRGHGALEGWRVEGEEYLRTLLQTPALQNSDLLCAFLSADISDFVDVIGGTELSLGRLLSTVRIRKENGQHLEPFIANLITATKRKPRTKKSRDERKSSPRPPAKSRRKLNLQHNVFGDNLGKQGFVPIKTGQPRPESSPCKIWPIQGIYDCIMYIVVCMLGAPGALVEIALALRHLLRGTVDCFYQHRLRNKLHQALGPARIVFLINLLREEISGQRGNSMRTSPELEAKTAHQVLCHLRRLVPWPLSRLPNTQTTMRALIAALRTPLLNKQLAYTLLDIVAEELFPELCGEEKETLQKT